MAEGTVLAANLFTHSNTALTTTAAAVTIPANSNRVFFNNPDAAINALISFDGTNFITLKPGLSMSFDCRNLVSRNQLKVKSASGTPTLEILFHSEA